jgi:prepilin-type N-terminal cleavage/methylation domain-containing protein
VSVLSQSIAVPGTRAGGLRKRIIRRGFTLVEVMTVVLVTTVGFVSLLNLQVGTIQGIGTARDMQQAMTLADNIAQTMRMEALQWTTTNPLTNNPAFSFLDKAPANTVEGQTSGWFVAYAPLSFGVNDKRVSPVGTYATPNIGAATEYLDTTGADITEKRFCSHVRLTWLIPDVLLRADVRVFWARHRADFTEYAQCAFLPGVGPDPDKMARNDQIQMISIPLTIIRNVFVRQV